MSLGEIGRSLTRLEGKMDRWAEDHEHRLRRCERWVYALPATALGAVAALVVAVLQWATQ